MTNQVPELRQRRVGEIIDAAIKVWSANFKTLVPLAAWITLPFQLASAYITYSIKPSYLDSIQTWQKTVAETGRSEPLPSISSQQVGAIVAAGVISLVSSYVVAAALTSFIGQLVLESAPSRRHALRVALRRSPVLLLSSLLLLLITLGMMAGVFALVIVTKTPGLAFLVVLIVPFAIWLGVRLSLSGPPIVLEKAGPIRGLRRSFTLTKGRWGAVLGTQLLSALIAGAAAAIISAVLGTVLRSLGGNNAGFEFVWTAISGTIAAAIATPITAAVTMFLYLDLRVRKEAFDLERLSADLASHG